ncbi:hypothetical protein C8Q79DRAFT_982331 [Trametes meyenii]|nr:hypothetical protein C8Q79DRAFT_982331 [Trametes meyenii]
MPLTFWLVQCAVVCASYLPRQRRRQDDIRKRGCHLPTAYHPITDAGTPPPPTSVVLEKIWVESYEFTNTERHTYWIVVIYLKRYDIGISCDVLAGTILRAWV